MSRVSVIVPVYNAKNCLKRCVDSVLAQSFTDFELILVDDGSQDYSLKICKHYSEIDSRVIVVSQTNGGVSSARNHGIKVAKGDYICFVDADDHVSPFYFEQLVAPALEDGRIDLVLQGRIKCEKNIQTIVSPSLDEVYFLSENSKFFDDINLFQFCAVYSKLFKRKIIQSNEVYFLKELNHGEDFDFLAKYLCYCNGVHVSSCANYYYMLNDGSLSSRFYNYEDEYTCMKHLNVSLSNLCQCFQDQALVKQAKGFLAYYTARVLTSIYEPPRAERSVRIKNLKSIDRAFVQLYREYFNPPTMNNKVFKFLYVNKCYRLFDMASLMWRRKMERGTIS